METDVEMEQRVQALGILEDGIKQTRDGEWWPEEHQIHWIRHDFFPCEMSTHGRVNKLELKSALPAFEILHKLLQGIHVTCNATDDQCVLLGVGDTTIVLHSIYNLVETPEETIAVTN